MAAERGWRRLGAVLVEAGLLDEGELVDALAEKERSGELLGTILVRRGLVSGAAVANALAEQHGGFLKSEHGFGTGLRDAHPSDGGANEPGPPPVSMTAPTQPDEASQPDGADTSPGTHLLFVPTAQGYLLLQRDGSAPSPGEHLELEDQAAKPLVVVKVAPSPLPADPRACAYLQDA
ncbi:MAG TPA: hypothetical protein VNR59_02905 [Gaiellaceae bacterium]|nr:hypothetical protein [Gaiellaceae bacterium]